MFKKLAVIMSMVVSLGMAQNVWASQQGECQCDHPAYCLPITSEGEKQVYSAINVKNTYTIGAINAHDGSSKYWEGCNLAAGYNGDLNSLSSQDITCPQSSCPQY